jgi:AcrR family transcriptional regulator
MGMQMRVKCESRRQAILDVAEEAFREKGFELTSMSEITARVGGSKATLYNYFASKEELFLEVMHRFAEADIRKLFDGLNPQDDLRETLQQFGETLINFIAQPKVIAAQRVLFAESGRTDIGKRFYDRGPCDGGAKVAEYLSRCVALGKLRELDAPVAARHLFSLLKSEIMEPLLFGAFDREALPPTRDAVQRAVDVFIRAYGRV